MQDDRTTLVCLFHHADQARAAVHDLLKAGVAENSVSTIGGDGEGIDALDKSELASLGMPDRDYDHLKQGIRQGNTVVAVYAAANHVAAVESVFGKHRAEQIDQAETTPRTDTVQAAAPLAAASSVAAIETVEEGTMIPVVEEDLLVGKRTVDQGGVRLYRRIVEVPVEASVQLREEHVSVDRIPVDRAINDADLAFQDRTIELTETAEEAVVGKEARVVEEIVVGKVASEHTETVRDTVRHTEVEVEDVPATTTQATTGSTYKGA